MSNEKYILCYGAGVNSTAILALLKMKKLDYPNLKILFADTGAEKPSTYCYLKEMQKHFDIKVVKSELGTLTDYCKKHNIIPVRQLRWCSDKFKIVPQRKWRQANGYDGAMQIIGFCKGEERRMKQNRPDEVYPLIELGIDREGCKDVIREIGWSVPEKSGCYICSFQRKLEWIALQRNRPDLFQVAVELERATGGRVTYKERPLIEWLKEEKKQERLIEFEEFQHCICRSD